MNLFRSARKTMMSCRELDLLDCLEHNEETGDLEIREQENYE